MDTAYGDDGTATCQTVGESFNWDVEEGFSVATAAAVCQPTKWAWIVATSCAFVLPTVRPSLRHTPF